MAILPMAKVTIAGSDKDQAEILSVLQVFGRCHIIEGESKIAGEVDTSQVPNSQDSLSKRNQRAQRAIDFLVKSRYKRRALSELTNFDFNTTVDTVLALKDKLIELKLALEKLEKRIKIVEPWGDFEFDNLHEMDMYRFWFYQLPVAHKKALEAIKLPWQLVGRTGTKLFIVLISREEPAGDILPVAREHLGSRSLRQLRDEQDHLQEAIDACYLQRTQLTKYLFLLRSHVIQADNVAQFHYVKTQACQQNGFFTLQAWLPRRDFHDLKVLSNKHHFAFIEENPKDTESPPTLLEPPRMFAAGALLSGFYQIPGYKGWDPSIVLFCSFLVFFAMILSDAGYAAVLLILVAGLWRFMGRSVVRPARGLMLMSGLVSLVWGVLVGSYWGFNPPESSILASLSVIDLSNYKAMMQLSCGVGVLHIVLALVISACSHRASHRANYAKGIVNLGWLVGLVTGFSYWLWGHLPILVAGVGASISLIIIGGLISSKESIAGFIKGLVSLTQVTKLFGDVLSYLRLFALGLASASLGLTFNQLALPALSGSGLEVLLGIGIFVIGHLINVLLGVMGGVVHGLRLIFIEFYGWGDLGEGYSFEPFELKEVTYE